MFTPPKTFVYTPQFQIPRNNPGLKEGKPEPEGEMKEEESMKGEDA